MDEPATSKIAADSARGPVKDAEIVRPNFRVAVGITRTSICIDDRSQKRLRRLIVASDRL